MKHTFDTSRDTFNTVSRMLLLTVLALAHSPHGRRLCN
jgi:hypothetical protein